MYTVTSDAGLHTSAATLEQATGVLGQHLHDMTPDGPVHWMITTPHGTAHTGHVQLNGLPDDGFLTDTITEITANLTREAGRTHLAV